MRRAIVTTYPNPDLDGVASAIVWSIVLTKSQDIHAAPVCFGFLDGETKLILRALQAEHSVELVTRCPTVDEIYVVDTHDAAQLDPSIDTEKVIAILDHHPSGDTSAFPRAFIDNQAVGAVATLLTEKIRSIPEHIGPDLLRLLNAAIISNTLNFSAPSTTERDIVAHEWLSATAPFSSELVEQMTVQRSILEEDTAALVGRNFKPYTIAGKRVGIVQVEARDSHVIALRSNLPVALDQLGSQSGMEFVFLSAVDLNSNTTLIYSNDSGTQKLLQSALDLQFSGNIATSPNILLRKTHFVPLLTAYFDRLGPS